MKSVLSLAAVVFFALSMNAQKIKFESEVIDYGKIEFKSDGKRVFKFTNTGDQPLTIKRTKATCGCTVPSKPAKPIFPGEQGEISVSYDTSRPGSFSKSITVYSNAKEGERKVLVIKGFVEKQAKK